MVTDYLVDLFKELSPQDRESVERTRRRIRASFSRPSTMDEILRDQLERPRLYPAKLRRKVDDQPR